MYCRISQFLRFNNTTFGIFLTALILLTLLIDPVPLQRLDMLFADWRFELRGAREPGPEVVIVAIDEKSLDDPDLGRWPWPYDLQAQLVDQLTAYGARAIGYDVVFSASDTSAGIENLQDIREWLRAHHDGRDDHALAILVDDLIAAADRDQRFADALSRSSRTVLG
jgi:CHASE2 domain-containing sensor protein